MLDGLSNVNDVVKAGLCTRCGACYGACPLRTIDWNERFFPVSSPECENCKTCLKVCGGIEVDFPRYAEKHYGNRTDLLENAVGPLLYSEAIFPTDEGIRKVGSSGGLVTRILISMIDQGQIDGAVVAGFSDGNPLQPEARIARNREQVIWGAQSKYVLFPVAHKYREIIDVPGRYAVVGLPCHLHSLFRWQEINAKLRERIVLIIGLFCHANLEMRALYDLLDVKCINPDDVAKLEFRGGGWPGGIQVTLQDGSLIPLHSSGIKDGAFNYLKNLYVAERCLLCIDYSAELSDIAISDPWLRGGNGEYMFQGGWSVAHVRTERGHKIISGMKSRKEIVAELIDKNLILRSAKSMKDYKKRGAFVRLGRLSKKRMQFPDYHLNPPDLSRMDYIREYFFEANLIGWHFNFLRRPLLKLAFSAFGEKVKGLRSHMKKFISHLSS